MPYDPSAVDIDVLQNRIDLVEEEEEKRALTEAEIERQQQAERAEKFAGQQEKIDAGNDALKQNELSGQKGLEEYGNKLQQAGDAAQGVYDSVYKRGYMGGLARGINGVFTFPERTFDWATGARQAEIDENGSYSPGWDPFREYIDDTKAQNWWETGVQWGTQEAVTIGATAGVGLVSGAGRYLLGRLGLGATEALLDPDTGEGDNLSGALRWVAMNPDKTPKPVQEFFDKVEATAPWAADALKWAAINNPLATNDGDDVNANTLKHILEGLMFEGTAEAIDFLYAGRRADDFDVQEQVMEQATDQFEVDTGGLPSNTIDVDAVDVTVDPAGGKKTLPEGEEPVGTWRASKNEPTAVEGQGKYTSRTKADQQWSRRQKQTDHPNDMGTIGSGFSALELEKFANKAGIPAEKMDQIAKQLYDSSYYQQALGSKSWVEGNQLAFRRFQKLIGGEAMDADPKKYWQRLYDLLGKDPKNWTIDPVISDLVTEDLFSQARNKGMSALALMDATDIMDTDGPMQNVAERFALFMSEVNKAKRSVDPNFASLPPAVRKQAMDEFSVDDYEMWSDEVADYFRFIRDQPNDELAKHAAWMFANHNITSMKDFGTFVRGQFKRGKNTTYKGVKGQKKMVREMNIMMMLSQLADPSTLMRAARGTAEILGIQTTARLLGATMTLDWRRARAAAAEYQAIREVFPDFLQIWKRNVDAWWNKDFTKMGNRYISKGDPQEDIKFDAFFEHEMRYGNFGDKLYANSLRLMRDVNRWQGISYPFAGLSSIDQAGSVVAANQRARNLAMMEALDGQPAWKPVGKEWFQEARKNYYNARVDADGNFDFESDAYLGALVQDAQLTKPIGGPLKHIDAMAQEYPEIQLFWRFMTTRVNDIMLDYKAVPVLGAVHKEFIDTVATINDGDMTRVMKYGIESMDDAITHRNMWMGRMALGTMALAHFMGKKEQNELNGNGNKDWRITKMWKDAGWKENIIKYGPLEIDLKEFSGLGVIIGLASDIVDNRNIMGDKWSDNALATLAFSLAAGLVSKEMYEPIDQIMRLDEEGVRNRWIASTATSLPFIKLINKLGKTLLPYQKEVSQNLEDQMRNRMQGFELLKPEDERLQPKTDILYGDKLEGWDYVQNAINEWTPLTINIRKERPATDFLTVSGYPMQIITNQHDGVVFKNDRNIRTAYGEALSKQGLGPKIEKLMKDKQFMQSWNKYQEDLDNNQLSENPVGSYYHLQLLNKVITKAKDQAWIDIADRPDVRELKAEAEKKQLEAKQRMYQTSTPTLQTMYR